ncbi:hypothetical protein [Flavobacterium sp.]|uniref:hypothetical protein n=1 Tax=Flavobacterium sp. TaxID=239 RepID=UPI002634AA42|nr:hypothetical protein [Flavobacterium sp.]
MKKINLEVIVLMLASILSIAITIKRLPAIDWMTVTAGISALIFTALLFKKCK